jgi:molybdopterin converting factor small subunit
MNIRVRYWSWLRDLTGSDQEIFPVPAGSSVQDVLQVVHSRHPALADVRSSTLLAVGVEYRPLDFILTENDEISLLPPVQGG